MRNLFDNVYICDNLKLLERNDVLKFIQQGNFVIFPHEWASRQKQIKNHFNSYSNNLYKIFARKCNIREISLHTMRQFCDDYHIQGSNTLALQAWGIFKDDDLLGVLSLGRHHRKKGGILLDRLCFNPSYRVVGGASKLMNAAKRWALKKGIDKIISFSDKRWSSGKVYEKMNFIKDCELPPDYFYVKEDNYLNYYSKQSQKKSRTGCPKEITEFQWSKNNNLLRVYDAGKIKWAINLTKYLTIKNPLSKRRTIYHESHKSGIIYCASSYELRAAILLDNDDEVITYSDHTSFVINGKNRFTDFVVVRKAGTTVTEIKPKRRLKEFAEQIEDNKKYAKRNNWNFELWTEKELGFSSEYFVIKWADKYLSQVSNVDFEKIRKNRNLIKAKKHYNNSIQNDKIVVFCDFCNEEHEILKISYERNIKKNGRFICIVENGHIIGKKPGKKKINPYAVEGKKQCNKCKNIKAFEDFSPDKTKSDGYSTRCKSCRAEIYKLKYKKNK